jgi:uncharacterized protein with HEPN domain
MASRPLVRLRHVKAAIRDIPELLGGRTSAEIADDKFALRALERLLEVISAASRNIPVEWRQSLGGEVPWPGVATLGNILRHAYDRVDVDVLWSIYENDLDPLEVAIDAMLATHDR